MDGKKSIAEKKVEDMTRVIDSINSQISGKKKMARINVDTKIWQVVNIKANVKTPGQMQQGMVNIPSVAVIDMQLFTSEQIEIVGETMVCIHEKTRGWSFYVSMDDIKTITTFDNESMGVNESKFESF